MKKVNGKNIVVVGLGKSGLAAAKLLAGMGASVWITEASKEERLRIEAEKIAAKFSIKVELGVHSKEFIENAELCVLSPGISDKALPVQWAMEKNIPIVSELEMANWFNEKPIIAITGSNGKSTTTALIHEMLTAGGLKSALGGNFGTPFSDILLNNKEVDVHVLEVSSFQLERSPTFSPNVAVLTNLTPNHLDRYGSMEEYCRQKGNIFHYQSLSSHAVLSEKDFKRLKGMGVSFPENISFSKVFIQNEKICIKTVEGVQDVCCLSDVLLEGEHNLENIFSAIYAVLPFKISVTAIKKVLTEFKGLAHRIEKIKNIQGIDYINDSKATSTDAVEKALSRFSSVQWIAGGRNKGSDFSSLIPLVKKHVRRAYFIGESKKTLAALFEPFTQVEIADTLEEATLNAKLSAQKGDVVLFSPGCSSFDMFRDFEHRGEYFKNIVNQFNV